MQRNASWYCLLGRRMRSSEYSRCLFSCGFLSTMVKRNYCSKWSCEIFLPKHNNYFHILLLIYLDNVLIIVYIQDKQTKVINSHLAAMYYYHFTKDPLNTNLLCINEYLFIMYKLKILLVCI